MIRSSETVLRGHPDKFSDQIADRILHETLTAEPDAYGQIECAVWSDEIFLTGAIVTREPTSFRIPDIVRTVGLDIGYTPGNFIDANRYRIHDHICRHHHNPQEWTRHVNDQAVITGWAGYDAKTRFLPPEHFLAHSLRETIDHACSYGEALANQGPDGKILVVINVTEGRRPSSDRWHMVSILVTLQHQPSLPLVDLQERLAALIFQHLRALAVADPRWIFAPDSLRLLINPNGPFTDGGSNSDNGQTGRKLVMDFYGPRVPIGGGALSGKDPSHIDRTTAYAARKACVAAVAAGAREAFVRVSFAPGLSDPIDVTWSFPHGGRPPADADLSFHPTAFPHGSLCQLGRGTHFFDPSLPWNQP